MEENRVVVKEKNSKGLVISNYINTNCIGFIWLFSV